MPSGSRRHSSSLRLSCRALSGTGADSMRADLSDTHPSAPRRRGLLFAALLLVAVCAFAALGVERPGGDPAGETGASPGQARGGPRGPERPGRNDRRTERGDRLDDRRSLGAAPGTGGGRGRTGRQSRRSSSRRPRRSRPEKAHLERVRAQLQRALGVLRDRLVAIYESGSPDMINAILDSRGLVRDGGADRIPEPDPELRRLGRRPGQGAARRGHAPRSPGSPTTAPRSRRRATRSPPRSAKSAAARDRSRGPLRRAEGGAGRAPAKRWKRSKSREEALSNNLASISEQIASEGGSVPVDSAGAAHPRPERRLHLRKPGQRAGLGARTRSRRRSRPPTRSPTTPYIWGGGHGSFESSGYDCSGRGQLRAARRRLARKPARLDRPLDLGRTGPGPVDHRLRQRRPRLDDRSPASPSTPPAAPAPAGTPPRPAAPKASSPATRRVTSRRAPWGRFRGHEP